jgi:hypothetical protein
MAITHTRAKEVATFAVDLSNEIKTLLWRIESFLKHNSANSIDWVANPRPDFLNEDVNGNLDGLHFSRLDLGNAIGSIDNIRKTLRNESVTQGDHLGNLEKLAKSDV